MEAGDFMIHKKAQVKMTILRFLGDEENDAMNMVDRQFYPRGYDEGSPMCQWFEGNVLKMGTFHPYEIELAKEKETVINEEIEEEEEDFDFDF
ncbi:MAG: hypothetical protein ACI94Y_001631 [Maribacter sp.]|jgi:hypothetical protein